MLRKLIPALAVVASLSTAAESRADFDATADFAISSNPNGVWSYGYTDTLTSAFVPFATPGTNGALESWGLATDSTPVIYRNTGGEAQDGTVHLAPNQLTMHPGAGGQFATLRFIAPSAGQYLIEASFEGADVDGTTTDGHLVLNGVSLFSGFVDGFGAATHLAYSSGSPLTLAAGDMIDLKVGTGSNGTYNFDSTAVTFHVAANSQAVPEPASALAVGTGLVMLILARPRTAKDGRGRRKGGEA